jgi:hypothetical protein
LSAREHVDDASQFVLIVVDRDTRKLTVEGPMSDVRPWNSVMVNAQTVGLNSCGSGDPIDERKGR